MFLFLHLLLHASYHQLVLLAVGAGSPVLIHQTDRVYVLVRGSLKGPICLDTVGKQGGVHWWGN